MYPRMNEWMSQVRLQTKNIPLTPQFYPHSQNDDSVIPTVSWVRVPVTIASWNFGRLPIGVVCLMFTDYYAELFFALCLHCSRPTLVADYFSTLKPTYVVHTWLKLLWQQHCLNHSLFAACIIWVEKAGLWCIQCLHNTNAKYVNTYASGTIAVNVTRLEREFNGCKMPRCIYPSIFNRFWHICTAIYWSKIATFSYLTSV